MLSINHFKARHAASKKALWACLILSSSLVASVDAQESSIDPRKIMNEGKVLNSTIPPPKRGDFLLTSVWWVAYEGSIHFCFADHFSINCNELQPNENWVFMYEPL
jgi:hypothetical protein